jgi:CBS domain-containing protein
MLAHEVMTKDVLTLTPDMSVDEARDLFFRNHIHGAPVVDHSGRLVGMVGFVDLAGQFGTRVLHIMRRDPVTAAEDTPIGEIAASMLTHEIRRIPIVRGTQVVGIIGASDVIRALLDLYEGRGLPVDEKA